MFHILDNYRKHPITIINERMRDKARLDIVVELVVFFCSVSRLPLSPLAALFHWSFMITCILL